MIEFTISTSHGTGVLFGTIWDLGGPLMCCYNLVQYIDYVIQIIFPGLPSMGQTPSFPIVTSHSKMLYPDFSWNIRLSIWNSGAALEGLLGPLRARKQLRHASNHHIFLHPPSMGLTPTFPIFELSHSKILYLNLSWNTRLSIWNRQGPWRPMGGS